MGKKRSFKYENEVFDIEEKDVNAFLKDVPDAVEVQSFVYDKDTFDIELSEVGNFLADVPDAKPLGESEEASKKKSSASTSTATEAGGGSGGFVIGKVGSPESIGEAPQHRASIEKKATTIKAPLPAINEQQSKSAIKAIAQMPDRLVDSDAAKVSFVANFSKQAGIQPKDVVALWDQAKANRRRLEQLESEYLMAPEVSVTPGEEVVQTTAVPFGGAGSGVAMEVVGRKPDVVTGTAVTPKDFQQRSTDMYELASLYNYFGDYDKAMELFYKLESDLKKQAEAELKDEALAARAPKNYIEQRQAPATQGLAYTAYLAGDRAESARITKILTDKKLLDVQPEMMPVGTGDFLQPSYTKPTYGFRYREGAEFTPEGGVVPASRPTLESEYLNEIAKGISATSSPLEPMYQMAEHGIKKVVEVYTADKPETFKDSIKSLIKLTTGIAESVAGVAGLSTGPGAAVAIPFMTTTTTMMPPEVAEWAMPVSKMVRNYYIDKGVDVKDIPEWATNVAVLGDFAILGLLHKGAEGIGKKIKGRTLARNRAKILDDFFSEGIRPEEMDRISKQVEKNWQAAGQDPVIYVEQIKERFSQEIKPALESIEAEVTEVPPYEPPPAPESLRTIPEGADVEMNGEIGKIERGDDGTWYFVNDKGESRKIAVTYKFNPTEKITELGIQVLPEVSEADVARAMADAEQTGMVVYNGKKYFVSIDRAGKSNPAGDRVFEVLADGTMIDRFGAHPDPVFAANRMLEITNAMLESKGLPKRNKNITPWKESERYEVEGGAIAFEPETTNMTGGKGQYVFYDEMGNARVITEQEYARLKENGKAVKLNGEYQPGYEGYQQGEGVKPVERAAETAAAPEAERVIEVKAPEIEVIEEASPAPAAEAKPEVEAELTPEETTITEEIKITQDEAKRAKQASPKRTRKSKDITAVIESETKAVESSGNAARAKDLIETVEATEQSILTDRPTKDTFEQKHGVSETAILQEMADMGKTGDFGKAYENLTGKEPTIEAEIDFLSAVSSEGGRVKPKMSIEFTEENNTVETLALPKKKATKSGIDSLKEIVSDDITRPVMQGIYFEDGNMIATDAHKLTIIPQTESFDVIVDKAAEARYKTYKKSDPSYTREKAKAQILGKLSGDLNGKIIDFLKGEVVEGKYPNYKSVIPDYKTSVTVDAQKLIDEVNGARAVQNNLQNNVFAIGIELNGETLYFNPRLLADVVETLQGNGAKKFELLSEGQKNRAVVIKTDNGMTGLVMPLEVKGEYPRSQSIKPTELGGIKGKEMPKTKVESAVPAEGAAGVTAEEAMQTKGNIAKTFGIGFPGGLSGATDVANSIKTFFKKYFTTRGFMPKGAFESMVAMRGAKSASMTEIKYTITDFANAVKKDYGKDFDNLPASEILKMNDYLKGNTSVIIPNNVAIALSNMRNHIDALSREMINAGLAEGDLAITIDQNQGFYVTRSFRKFDDPAWARIVPESIRNQAKAWARSQYPTATTAEIDGLIEYLLYEPGAPMSILSEAKIGSKDLNIFKKRKDIPFELRQLFGEYNDPILNYARSVFKMSSLIEHSKFLNAVYADGLNTYFFEKPTGKFHVKIASDTNKSYNPLSGLYTTPEIAEAFSYVKSAMKNDAIWDKIVKGYMAVNATVKQGKTVLSPQTHVRNTISNLVFVAANGHFLYPKSAQKAWSVVTSEFKEAGSRSQLDYVMKLKQLGVLGESTVAGEMIDMIKDATNRYDEVSELVPQTLLKRVVGLAEKAYSLEDGVFKVFAFEAEKARYIEAGYSLADAEAIAANNVRSTYPTYSLVPKIIKEIRKAPLVGTFVSFPAEVIRTYANTWDLAVKEMRNPQTQKIGATRVAGLILATIGVKAAAEYSAYSNGVTQDEEEALRKMQPPWSKNSDYFYVGRDSRNVPIYVDLGYSDPYNYLKKPINALMYEEDTQQGIYEAMKEVFGPFLGYEMLYEKLTEVQTNQKRSGGKVYNEQLPLGDKLAAAYNHISSAIEPGVVTSARRIYKGYKGESSETGRQYNLNEELFAITSGQRISRTNVATAFGFKTFNFKNDMQEAKRIYNTAIYQTEDPVKRNIAYNQSIEAQKRIYDEYLELYNAALKLGETPKSLKSIMSRYEVGKALIKNVQGNLQYKPEAITITEFKLSDKESAVENFIRFYKDPKLTPKQKNDVIMQGVVEGRTWTEKSTEGRKSFMEELKRTDLDLYYEVRRKIRDAKKVLAKEAKNKSNEDSE